MSTATEDIIPRPARGLALRYLTVAILLPGYILLLIHGLLTGFVVPALGIAPLTGSAIQGAVICFLRTMEKSLKARGAGRQILSTKGVFWSDMFLAAFHFGVLIATPIVLACSYRFSYGYYGNNRTSDFITAIFCTLFDLVPMLIHLFYAITALAEKYSHDTWQYMHLPQEAAEPLAPRRSEEPPKYVDEEARYGGTNRVPLSPLE